MVLSRLWYVLLGLAVAVALYVVYIAVGEYDRQTTLALKEGLASDSQTVEWALRIDTRRRLDALLPGSVDPVLQQALVLAGASKDGKVPDKSKTDAKKALAALHDAMSSDFRTDALLAVDRDGRVVANVGYEPAAGNEEFEAGGYPAVNDALHGWLRDDIWMLGTKVYIVVTRPVEYDVAQRPAGAIIGLKEINGKFVQDLANRTRASVAFFVSGRKVAGGGAEGFPLDKLDAVAADLKTVDEKSYHDGRTDARMLGSDLGVMYARLPGDVWSLGGGFAVARTKTTVAGPMGFLSGADDKDKSNVPWQLLGGVVLVAALLGIGATVLEHTLPLRELVNQAERLKVGATDGLHVARFRGAYRLAAQSLNEGIERAIEKAGGVTRKPADLESILGPAPAQPAMSAFSFPMAPDQAAPATPPAAPAPPPVPPPYVRCLVPGPRPRDRLAPTKPVRRERSRLRRPLARRDLRQAAAADPRTQASAPSGGHASGPCTGQLEEPAERRDARQLARRTAAPAKDPRREQRRRRGSDDGRVGPCRRLGSGSRQHRRERRLARRVRGLHSHQEAMRGADRRPDVR